MHQLEIQICGLGLLGKKKEPEKVNKSVLTTAPLFVVTKGFMSQNCRGSLAQDKRNSRPKERSLIFRGPRVGELLKIEPFPPKPTDQKQIYIQRNVSLNKEILIFENLPCAGH